MTLEQAYEAGKKAKRMDAQRVSPYYEEMGFICGMQVDLTAALDQYWFAGYDGKPMPEAVKV